MEPDDNEIRCQIMWQLKQDKKYDEIADHVLTCCLDCITNPRKQFGGREMLFPDAPPPWIKMPESEKSDPQAWRKYQKRQVHQQMTPEEFDDFLIESDFGDERMCHEIAKFKRIERVEAWIVLRELRKKQRERRLEAEKIAREIKKRETDEKREAEKLKKMDEKLKIQEKKQQKDDEKQEYLDKIHELEEVLGVAAEPKEGPSLEPGELVVEPRRHQKVYNVKNSMPWAPSPYDVLCSEHRSTIPHQQQKRMNAMYSNLMYFGEFQHTSNRRELKDIRAATETEYDTLVASALEHAKNEACHPLDVVDERKIQKCLDLFKNREPPPGENLQFTFKDPVYIVENVDAADGIRGLNQALVPKIEKLLRKGVWNDVLTLPDISQKCPILNIEDSSTPPPKVKLLDDALAASYIAENPTVTLMADATTICHLLTPNWESRDYDYTIPCVVREENLPGVGWRKVVVLSKPMPSGRITKASIQRKSLKRALRSQFLLKKSPKIAEKPVVPDAIEVEPTTTSEAPAEARGATDFLDDILTEMATKKSKKEAKNEEKIPENQRKSTYQYGIFRIGDARLLVRSNAPYGVNEPGEKKHAFLHHSSQRAQAQAHMVTFEPRIEYLPNGGAMDLGAPEWCWNFTKAVLKMSDSHILYRTSYRLDHILQIDALTMKVDVQEPPPGAFGLLSARCVMLEKLINRLETLNFGEYMIVHEANKPLTVIPQCERGGVTIEAMRITGNEVQSSSDTAAGDSFFYGFSPDLPFQWQIIQGRAPRMLLAKDSPLANNLPTKQNFNKIQWHKSQVKRKYEQYSAEREDEKRNRTLDLDDPNISADFTNPAMIPVKFERKFYPPRVRGRRGGRGRSGGRGGGRGRERDGGSRGRGGRGGRGNSGNEPPVADIV